MSSEFRYQRRVQFAETDLAGIVHFSTMFRYMEEAEHALWRSCGLTIAERGSSLGWPRLNAALEFRHPLRF
jgi:acyl-CoA thioester hydrolase